MTRPLTTESRSGSARSLRARLKGITPLHEAAKSGNVEALKHLADEAAAMRSGRYRRGTMLMLHRASGSSTGSNSSSENSMLSTQGSIVSPQTSMQSIQSTQSTHGSAEEAAHAIGAATHAASTSISSIFMAEAVNGQTKTGKSPLMLACAAGHLACVEFLVGCGANPLLRSRKHHKTCLHYALEGGHVDVVELLLTASSTSTAQQELPRAMGAARSRLVEQPDSCGHTPLFYAIASNSEAAVALLIKHGADVNARAPQSGVPCGNLVITDELPMHVAARMGSLGMVKMLLRAHFEMEGAGRLPASGGLHVDPRTVKNCYWRLPCQVARRAGATWLADVLDPAYPIRLVLWGEDSVISWAPHHIPCLAVIAAGALQAKLESELCIVEATVVATGRGNGSAKGGRRGSLEGLACSSLGKILGRSSRGSRDGRDSPAGAAGVARSSSREGLARPRSGRSSPGPDAAAAASGRASCEGGGRANMEGLARCSRGSSASGCAGAAAAAGDAACSVGDADDEHCCGVCLEQSPAAQMMPCMHRLCVDCARGVCKSYRLGAPICPFCRGYCAAFRC